MLDIRLADIAILNGRQRHELGDIESLAQDLLMPYGQLVPILVRMSKPEESLRAPYVLISGERRYRAHELNGAATIQAIIRDVADPLELEQMELAENLQRKDLTWQERNAAIARIHRIQLERNPNWTVQQTAMMVTPTDEAPRRASVTEAVKLEEAMKLFPEIAAAKTQKQAYNLLRAKAQNIIRMKEVADRPDEYLEVEQRIIHGDMRQVVRSLADNTCDHIITDPPFGIDYGDRVAGTVGEATSYSDDAAEYESILATIPELYRVIKPNGFLIWFLGISWYEHVKQAFISAGFTVDEIPLIWKRDKGRCFTNRPDRYLPRGYDIALQCFKGDNPQIINRRPSNIFDYAPVGESEKEILVERPVELYADLIKTYTLPGQTVWDFFVGSGSCSAAAVMLGRDYRGVELDAARRSRAIQKIKAHTPE